MTTHEKAAQPAANDSTDKSESPAKHKESKKEKDAKDPPGGYDATPIPRAHDGFTVRFTFHRATHLPMADLSARSSDPFIEATLTSDMPTRHKEDPPMVLRTRTIHRSTNPVWDQEWIVAGIPSSGFRLKCRIYDEDSNDHDDRLGNVTVHVNKIGADWQGIKQQPFDIKKRMGSKRAYLIRACAVACKPSEMDGTLYLSAEVLGESEKPHGRMYTIGPQQFTKHYSPVIGRLAGITAPGSDSANTNSNGEKKTEKYEYVSR